MKAMSLTGCVLSVVLGCVFTVPAIAGQLYRCGNAYQDHPCEGNQTGKPVKGVGAVKRQADSTGSTERSHPECARRGEDSQKIVWARESGVTLADAMSSESNPKTRQLIADVYRVRGSAPEVRVRIEAECKTEMEEKAKLIALHEAMVKAAAPTDQAARVPGDELQPSPAVRPVNEVEEREQSRQKKQVCDQLSRSIESNRSAQRTGGDPAAMDKLNLERKNLERSLRSSGCA
ncbi:MAG: hypothetical protein ACKVQA_18065 [Burkholderiales bacterium]